MKSFNNHSGLRGLPCLAEGIHWATGLSRTTPFTEGRLGVNDEASPPGRHQEQAPKQRCTFSSTTFSSVQCSWQQTGCVPARHGAGQCALAVKSTTLRCQHQPSAMSLCSCPNNRRLTAALARMRTCPPHALHRQSELTSLPSTPTRACRRTCESRKQQLPTRVARRCHPGLGRQPRPHDLAPTLASVCHPVRQGSTGALKPLRRTSGLLPRWKGTHHC